MVKIVFTKHASLKLWIYRVHKLKISTQNIKKILISPKIHDESDWPVRKAIGKLDEKHSLVIIYKTEDDKIIIITFWPAEKGRYESQIQ